VTTPRRNQRRERGLAPRTYEAAFTELQDVVRQLELGPPSLDEVLALVERGTQLADLCDELLSSAELNITRLSPESASLLPEPPADT
jgi:exodeoxyribonuclease VII small subunit